MYPYEYMDTWVRFAEPKLPPKETFYSKLSDAHISDDDYAHAQKVWEAFGCETLGDYSDLYCRTDVLLLADVFETFRRTCQEQHGLDPAQYYTSPGLSWDALLKKSGVELELLIDYDQHLFIEKGMRGRQAQAPHRQPNVCSSQYLRRRLGSYPGPQEPPSAQSPGVRGDERSGSLQAPDVRLLLQPAPGAIRGLLPAPLHRHRQSPPRGLDRGCLQGHGLPRRALRHLGLPTGAPPTQHRQQKSAGEDEERVCRAPHCQICRSAP